MGYGTLKTQHTSLQYSDSPAQQEHDVKALFEKGKLFPIKTGTESGPETAYYELLKHYAKKHNHALHIVRENWVAVDRAIIKPGSVHKGEVFVASNDDVVGHMHDRILTTLSFTHRDTRFGRIAQGAAHYPRRGAKPGQPNYDINVLYAKRIHSWMKAANGRGTLSFVNGDFNMLDNKTDWDFGKGFTSMGDELKKNPNTGHGSIDGFASYDKDSRVKAKKLEVLNDKKMFMNTDHYVVRGWWTVRYL